MGKMKSFLAETGKGRKECPKLKKGRRIQKENWKKRWNGGDMFQRQKRVIDKRFKGFLLLYRGKGSPVQQNRREYE